jgi:hypothetical protein
MTHPRTPTDPGKDNVVPAPPAQDPLAPSNVPQGDFIDVATNEPVDPARLQVFEVPKQFLDWVLRKEPPPLDPENLKDSGPHAVRSKESVPPARPPANTAATPNTNTNTNAAASADTKVNGPARAAASSPLPASTRNSRSSRDKDTVPEFKPEKTPVTAVPVSTGNPPSAAVSHPPRPVPPTKAPASFNPTKTASMRVRPPLSDLDRWALTGRIPMRIKVAVAAGLGLLILLLWWHLDSGSDTRAEAGEGTPAPGTAEEVAAAAAPRAAPVPSSEAIAAPGLTPGASVAAQASIAPASPAPSDNEAIVDIDEPVGPATSKARVSSQGPEKTVEANPAPVTHAAAGPAKKAPLQGTATQKPQSSASIRTGTSLPEVSPPPVDKSPLQTSETSPAASTPRKIWVRPQ